MSIMKAQDKWVVINDRKVFYWEQQGHRPKETIVLLHGFPGNHLGLVPMASHLGSNYRIIIPDLPACGHSQDFEGDHSLNHYSDWLNDFLESLSINKAVIIGHSFGSR